MYTIAYIITNIARYKILQLQFKKTFETSTEYTYNYLFLQINMKSIYSVDNDTNIHISPQ